MILENIFILLNALRPAGMVSVIRGKIGLLHLGPFEVVVLMRLQRLHLFPARLEHSRGQQMLLGVIDILYAISDAGNYFLMMIEHRPQV